MPYHDFMGKQRPIRMYEALLDSPTLPIVFDDIRQLLSDRDCLDLVKQIAEHAWQRIIRWNSRSVDVSQRSVVIQSKVLMVLNWVPRKDSDVEAILDRFDVVQFEPTRQEVLNELRRVYPRHLNEIETISALDVEVSFRSFNKYLYWKQNEQFGFKALDNLVAEFGVNPAVASIADVMRTTPQKLWRDEYERRSGKTKEAAQREFTRLKVLAKDLV